MLVINVPAREFYDESSGNFIAVKAQTLRLEHSLISVSKWEAIYKKPFIDPLHDKTREETVEYIRCMTIDSNIDPLTYTFLTNDIINKVNDYIADPMSAYKKQAEEGKGSVKKQMTSEEIYYLMIAGEIPFECQKWHLNRLLSLIAKVGEETEKEKNKSKKKMPQKKVASNFASINAARRQALNSGG